MVISKAFAGVAWDSVRFTWLYLTYGAGYKWAYSGENSLLGMASAEAKRKIQDSEPSVGKEIGYWCGAIPGGLLGELLYTVLEK
jgi:hypothetical protein